MRLNKLIAQATGIGRRSADAAISEGRVTVDGQPPVLGQDVPASASVTLDGKILDTAQTTDTPKTTILFHKPTGCVVSRNGQGSRTIYDLLPAAYQALKPIGRLDKESSGLLLLTNDGQLAFGLTHPSKQKTKIYEVTLDKPLRPLHHQMISDYGIMLDDGRSKLHLERLTDSSNTQWRITMHEGRNRQIRRTFRALGYGVIALHRTQFGNYKLGTLAVGDYAPA